jgi:hypothetical protein
VLEIREIEEKLERVEQNERKLEALYARVDSLERLRSRERPENCELDVVRSEEAGDIGKSEEQQV